MHKDKFGKDSPKPHLTMNFRNCKIVQVFASSVVILAASRCLLSHIISTLTSSGISLKILVMLEMLSWSCSLFAESKMCGRMAANVDSTLSMASDRTFNSWLNLSIHSNIELLISSCNVSPASLESSPGILFFILPRLSMDIPISSHSWLAYTIAFSTISFRWPLRNNFRPLIFTQYFFWLIPSVCMCVYICSLYTHTHTLYAYVYVHACLCVGFIYKMKWV